MSNQKLDVIVKAVGLMEYTLTITSNRKRYPNKYVTLVKRIQDTCMNIYEFLLDANRLNIDISKVERNELQTKAIAACDKLSCYAEISMNLNLIGSDSTSYWQKQINDVKYMTISWRSKDKTR